ncbi:MAG TPA: hypothetical protein PK950_02815 [Candidatus Paceibacterota bacterium]|nr:hypothetical protein [Candidatus Paceibacterota bacterium]
MKNLLFLILFCSATICNAQHTIRLSRTAPNNAGDYLHKIANVFADSVGKALKAYYPATIETSSIEVTAKTDGNYITLTYELTIESADEESALYYFDHRGALSVDQSCEESVADAKLRAERQTTELQRKIGNIGPIFGSINNITSTTFKGQCWSLSENFIAWGK